MTDHKPKPFLAWFLAALKSARLERLQGQSSCRAWGLTAGWPSAVVLCQQRHTRFSGKKSLQTFPSLDIHRTFSLKDVICHRCYFFPASPCLPPPLHRAAYENNSHSKRLLKLQVWASLLFNLTIIKNEIIYTFSCVNYILKRQQILRDHPFLQVFLHFTISLPLSCSLP